MGLHFYKESFKYLEKFWSYRAYTKNCEKMQREITRKVSKLELCHLCAACLIIWIYIPIKVHPNTLNNFGVMEYTQKFVRKNIKKIPISKNCIFHQKIGNQLKRIWYWYDMKAETLKKTCVKFEARRLNALRENGICKKVNINVNQERAACLDNPILITRFFLRKTWLKMKVLEWSQQISSCKSMQIFYYAQGELTPN